MQPESKDQQPATSVEPAESGQDVSATTGSGPDATGANGGATAELALGSARGRHKPILKVHALVRSAPKMMLRLPDLKAIWVDGRLDPAFREEIMLSVAGANHSRQCSFVHREWALAEGLPESELAALEFMQSESFDARKWAAIEWAQAIAGNDFENVPDEIDANFRRHLSDQDQADVELAARMMTWMNLTSNTVDAALLRLKGRPVPGSGPLREVVALVLYAIFAPMVLAWLIIKKPRRPISLIGRIPPFFREFEARGPHSISGQGVDFRAESTA